MNFSNLDGRTVRLAAEGITADMFAHMPRSYHYSTLSLIPCTLYLYVTMYVSIAVDRRDSHFRPAR